MLLASAGLGARALHVMWREAERARVRAGSATHVPADASDPELLRVAARRAEAAGDAPGAAARLAALIRRRPLDAEARLRLGAALAAQGDVAAASAHIAAATALARNDPALWVHAARARLAVFRARGALAELQQALRLLRDAVERDPTLLGAVQGALGDDLGTPENLARILPEAPAAWRLAGAHFARQGRWEWANAAYARAGALGEEPAVQAIARATAAARAGDAAAALDAADLAVAAATAAERPGIVAAATGLLRALPPEWHDRALERCAGWVARHPETPAAALALARWRAARGETVVALELLASLPPAVRQQPDVLAVLADVSALAGQHGAAEMHYRAALDAEPWRLERWLALLQWLEGRGRVSEALALADRARGRHPEDTRLREVRQRLLQKSVRPPGG
jgi:tetratricopeptide (TPR) repeat protein